MRTLFTILACSLFLNTAQAQELDLHQVQVLGGSPGDVAEWPITTTITAIDVRNEGECCFRVDFTKKDGPDRWPDIVPPGWDGPLQYTLWAVVRVGDRWVTSGGIEYWHGKNRSGGPPSGLAANWYYHVSALALHQPAPGEQVGFFVTAGDQRAKDVHFVRERSNVVLVAFPSDAGAQYVFSASPPAPIPTPQPVPVPVPQPVPAPQPVPQPMPPVISDPTPILNFLLAQQIEIMKRFDRVDEEIVVVGQKVDDFRAAVKSRYEAIVNSPAFKYLVATGLGWLAHLAIK